MRIYTMEKQAVTHVFRDFTEFDQTKSFTGLCGENSARANYLSVREVMGAPPVNHNEVHLSQEDRDNYIKNLCPECANSEEFALLVLAL